MDIIGVWEKNGTGELIKISDCYEGDTFLLEYGENFEKSEKIELFLYKSDGSKYAHLPYSEKFNTMKINILSDDCLQIGDSNYKRHLF